MTGKRLHLSISSSILSLSIEKGERILRLPRNGAINNAIRNQSRIEGDEIDVYQTRIDECLTIVKSATGRINTQVKCADTLISCTNRSPVWQVLMGLRGQWSGCHSCRVRVTAEEAGEAFKGELVHSRSGQVGWFSIHNRRQYGRNTSGASRKDSRAFFTTKEVGKEHRSLRMPIVMRNPEDLRFEA